MNNEENPPINEYGLAAMITVMLNNTLDEDIAAKAEHPSFTGASIVVVIGKKTFKVRIDEEK